MVSLWIFLFVKPIYNSEINELIIQIIYRNNKKLYQRKVLATMTTFGLNRPIRTQFLDIFGHF